MFEINQNNNEKFEFLKSMYPNAKVSIDLESFDYLDNPRAEYEALTLGVALKDIPHPSVFEISGQGALDFLNRISTNLLNDLKPYESRWTLFTNEKGRIIDRTLVINFNDNVLLIGSAEFKNKLFSWLNKYILLEDLKLNDISPRYSIFELSGSQAHSFMTLVFDNEIENRLDDQLGPFRLNDYDYWIVKKNDFNIKKYFIFCKPENGIHLIKYMLENKSVFDFRIVGREAYDLFRIERGIPSVPNEINDFINPYENGLIGDVNFSKGCYIGQEVIARLETYNKVQRNLKGIVCEENVKPIKDSSVFYETTEIGRITSTIYSPSLKKNIGLALIKKDFNANGLSAFTKNENGTSNNITIVDLPIKK